MINITTVRGDATEPQGIDDSKVIVHCCNDQGLWGSGFVLALTAKWLEPELWYRRWHGGAYKINGKGVKFELGGVQFVPLPCSPGYSSLVVANLIGQHRTRAIQNTDGTSEPPIRYPAIREGLQAIREYCQENQASVHCPQFGSDRAGGDWTMIEQLIQEELADHDIAVTVYEFVPAGSVPAVPAADTESLMPDLEDAEDALAV